jgi:hypothetical protein
MGRFIFTGENVATFNDRVCIHYPFEFPTPFSVNAVDFYDTVARLDSEDINMRVDGTKIVIDTERSKGVFSTVVQEVVGDTLKKINKEIEECEWYGVPEDFIQAINFVKFSASSDNTSTWSCVRFDGPNVYCGEIHRFSWYIFDEPLIDTPFMIKAVNIEALSLFDIKAFTVSDNWAHFSTEEEVVFSARLTKGEYTEPTKPFNLPKGPEIELPDSTIKDIEFVSVMQADNMEIERTIDIVIENEKITYLSSKGEKGNVERTAKTTFKTDERRELKINPVFLNQILNKAEGMKVYLGKEMILFDSDNFKHLVALKV